jgi:hypothetical protein
MRKGTRILIGVVLLAAVVFGSVKVFQHHGGDGRSAMERVEDELGDESDYPYATRAREAKFVTRFCQYAARSESQLRSCQKLDGRRLYEHRGDDYRWLYGIGATEYCGRGAGLFCGHGRPPGEGGH